MKRENIWINSYGKLPNGKKFHGKKTANSQSCKWTHSCVFEGASTESVLKYQNCTAIHQIPKNPILMCVYPNKINSRFTEIFQVSAIPVQANISNQFFCVFDFNIAIFCNLVKSFPCDSKTDNELMRNFLLAAFTSHSLPATFSLWYCPCFEIKSWYKV